MIKVWDPVVRVLHWSLVALFVVAWQSPLRSDLVHEWSGYACLMIVTARVLWGMWGGPHARFSAFLRSPSATARYVRALAGGRAPRYAGHNPLGGWMIVALLATMAVVCVTGWMFTTDRFWGVAWVRTTHDLGTDILLGLIAVHIFGNAAMSILHRENLIAAMWHGRKRAGGI